MKETFYGMCPLKTFCKRKKKKNFIDLFVVCSVYILSSSEYDELEISPNLNFIA